MPHRRASQRRVLVTALIATLVAQTNPAAAGHGSDEATVVVQATAFQPYKLHVNPGATVTWDVREDGHTIVAEDGHFDFRGDGGGTLVTGAAPSFTVGGIEEFIPYYCTVHGSSMAGVIVVGHPKPVVADPTVIAVPGDGPVPMSIEGAVAAAEPGTRIEIAPGRYTVSEQVEVDLRDEGELPQGVTIVGMGDDPSDVVVEVALIPQQGAADAVLHVTGAFVTVGNLTVDAAQISSTGAGIHLDGANQAALWDVVVDGGGWARDGVRITDASGAALHGVTARDVRRAGVRIEPCVACGVLIEHADLAGGLVGVLASGAQGVIVRDSRIGGNAAGVVARRHEARLSSIQVYGNHIADNDVRDRLPAVTDQDRALATGAGVWLDGAADSSVTGNVLAGNTFGVVVSGGARGVNVTANTLPSNGLDLAWDGIGADTCFAHHPDDATSAPPAIHTLYPCDRPTAGLAYPPVNLSLLLAAYA